MAPLWGSRPLSVRDLTNKIFFSFLVLVFSCRDKSAMDCKQKLMCACPSTLYTTTSLSSYTHIATLKCSLPSYPPPPPHGMFHLRGRYIQQILHTIPSCCHRSCVIRERCEYQCESDECCRKFPCLCAAWFLWWYDMIWYIYIYLLVPHGSWWGNGCVFLCRFALAITPAPSICTLAAHCGSKPANQHRRWVSSARFLPDVVFAVHLSVFLFCFCLDSTEVFVRG